MNTIVMNTEISKISEPYKFVFNFLQRLNQIISNKHVVLQTFAIYYKWKNIRQQYKNNNLKIIAP